MANKDSVFSGLSFSCQPPSVYSMYLKILITFIRISRPEEWIRVKTPLRSSKKKSLGFYVRFSFSVKVFYFGSGAI